ncbi:hypothetical protein GQ44DRAFT_629757 [Phaeosphaeriaceae sp. PMI808]|nr:hypothetical protein GQ44DRAFT_629757 [Phaeosphaeriaceae sp. PMI808]
MCRVEERVYIGADGNRSKFEDTYPCNKARNGRLCAKVNRRTTEYYPKKGTISRNDTPSPINPPTPVGTGTYIVQQRRPSSSGGRPSTRDGLKAIKPEIVIEFGSKNDKNKVSVSAKTYKRPTIVTSSVDDVAVESLASDASHTIRTGFPEAPIPPLVTPYAHTDSYGTTPTIHHGYHHRQTSSTSSFTGSSRTPSLYVTSDPDYDSPTTTRNTRLPPAIIHNPSTTNAPPSPSRPRIHGGNSSAPYNTALVTPHYLQESYPQEGLFPMDYQDFADRSGSSHASSSASIQSRRGKDHDQPRKKKSDDRRQLDEFNRSITEALAKEEKENIKQVRFELGRAESRTKERAETLLAEKEKQRARDREEARRRASQEREREREREREQKEKLKTSMANSSSKRPAAPRRASISMTQSQLDEQRRLLAADLGHMQGESRATEAREREENLLLLKQKQQDTSYYNPRTGPMPIEAPTLTRRDSQSRRNSVSAETRPPTIGRTNSNRRASIVQPNPPAINTHGTSNYPRPANPRSHAPPPVSFPSNFSTRPQSTRHPSFSTHENPFAAPPSRGSNSSIENPFAPAQPVASPPVTVHQDPWDARYMLDSLPAAKPAPNTQYSRTGAARPSARFPSHDVDYVTDSDEEVTTTHGHGRKRW